MPRPNPAKPERCLTCQQIILPEESADTDTFQGKTYHGNPNHCVAAVHRIYSPLMVAAQVVHHQLSVGEASDGERRDIRFCARQLKEAIDHTRRSVV